MNESSKNKKHTYDYFNNPDIRYLMIIWSGLMILLIFIVALMKIFTNISYNKFELTNDKLLDYRIISALNPKYPPPLFNFT